MLLRFRVRHVALHTCRLAVTSSNSWKMPDEGDHMQVIHRLPQRGNRSFFQVDQFQESSAAAEGLEVKAVVLIAYRIEIAQGCRRWRRKIPAIERRSIRGIEK